MSYPKSATIPPRLTTNQQFQHNHLSILPQMYNNTRWKSTWYVHYIISPSHKHTGHANSITPGRCRSGIHSRHAHLPPRHTQNPLPIPRLHKDIFHQPEQTTRPPRSLPRHRKRSASHSPSRYVAILFHPVYILYPVTLFPPFRDLLPDYNLHPVD
jgi:hypothetical protein